MKTRLLLQILVLLISAIGFSQPGEIDNSFNSSGIGAFGGSGLPSTPPTSAQSSADCIVYKSDVYPATAGAALKDKIVIIGRFTSYNGVARRYIARLNADGTIDTSFGDPLSGVTGYLYCVKVLPSGHVLIGGDFTKNIGGGRTITNFGRLLPNGDWDPSFNAGTGTKGTNGLVHALCLETTAAVSRIIIGGTFTKYNGSAGTRRVIRLLADGTPDPAFTTTGSVDGEVRALAIHRFSGSVDDNRILVGGFFNGHSSQGGRGKLVRLLPNGDYDTTFNPSGTGFSGGDVYDILVRSGLPGWVIAVGDFTKYNGADRKSIAEIRPDGATSTNTIGVTSGLRFIFVIKQAPDNKFLIGGNFTNYGAVGAAGTVPKGIARLNNNLTLDNTFLTGTGFNGGTDVYQGTSVIRDIVIQSNGKSIVGGDYTQYDGTARRMLCRIKTRECLNTAIYNEVTGWDNDALPTDDTFYTAIVSGTYTIPSGTHLRACELEIKPGATLIISPNASITVKGTLMNNGTFKIDDQGSLVQINDATVNADLGDGIFTMDRKTAPVRKFDYTYWSSPVDSLKLVTVSPLTRFDKYHKYNAVNSTWITIPYGNEYMEAGKGYIMRSPNDFSETVPQVYTTTFSGRPRNGRILTPVMSGSTAGKWNLIGNPYPSAIDADAFLNDVENIPVIDGTIYIWTHQTSTTPNGSGQYVYSANDYITYNKTGGVVTAPTGVAPFDGKIAPGQGFFIKAIQNNSTAKFKNAMRVPGVSNFYRQNNPATQSVNGGAHNRVWLDLTNSQGAFNQILVGYEEGASNGFDRGYDGEALSGSSVRLYSLLNETRYTIQGRALPFDVLDEVPLGFNVTAAGSYTISLSSFDGLFGEQKVYLRDNTMNVTHDLKESAYAFTAAAGTFNNRFVLVYRPDSALGNPDHVTADDELVVSASDKIGIRSQNALLSKVEIFDILGKKIYESSNDIQANEFTITSISRQNQALLVRATLENGSIVNKKIVF